MSANAYGCDVPSVRSCVVLLKAERHLHSFRIIGESDHLVLLLPLKVAVMVKQCED